MDHQGGSLSSSHVATGSGVGNGMSVTMESSSRRRFGASTRARVEGGRPSAERGRVSGQADTREEDDGRANSKTVSEEDYDSGSESVIVEGNEEWELRGSQGRTPSVPAVDGLQSDVQAEAGGKRNHGFIVSTADDLVVSDAVRHGLHRFSPPHPSSSGGEKAGDRGRRGSRAKFTDLVFTRKFSAFDRQNQETANSPFHGFFTLFWMSVFFFVVKIGLDNWKIYGSPLGTNEIMRNMFRRDVLVLLIADGVMCGMTGASWALQRAVKAGLVNWDRTGWVLQNVSGPIRS